MPAKKQTPLFSFGDFTRHVYVVTKYRKRPDGVFVASEKFDVTQDFIAFARRMQKEGII